MKKLWCLQLTAEQLGMYMDLGPYANPSYYVVQEDMSLSKVYTLFRTLALRHVCVIPRWVQPCATFVCDPGVGATLRHVCDSKVGATFLVHMQRSKRLTCGHSYICTCILACFMRMSVRSCVCDAHVHADGLKQRRTTNEDILK